MEDGYLRIDETKAFLAAMDLLSSSVVRLRESEAWFVWALLASHQVAQSAMVLHLSGTMQLGALKKESARAWKEYHEAPDECRAVLEQPKSWLAPFDELLARLQKEPPFMDRPGDPVSLSSKSVETLKRLNSDRNDAIHFIPKGWSFLVVRLRENIHSVLDLVDSISNCPSGWAFRRLSDGERSQAHVICQEMKRWCSSD